MIWGKRERLNFLGMAFALASACAALFAYLPLAQGAQSPKREAGESRRFWIKTQSGYRSANTELKAVGERSYIYVENSLWEKRISREFVERLSLALERQAPEGAILPDLGIVPLEEKLFAPLPKVISRDDRVSVVFADISNNQFVDGYFHPYDQVSASEAEAKGQRSNEGNVIYVNGLRRSESYTTSVIAQELQKLLSFYPSEDTDDLWFRETMGKAAKLASGFYVDQPQLNQYAQQPSLFPLVSYSYVQQGPQLLFAAFLLDSMPDKVRGLQLLTSFSGNGRRAVEILFREISGSPLNFDVIFSKYLSYLFAGTGRDLPNPRRSDSAYLKLPPIRPYATIKSFPADIRGELMPYSVLVIDLPEALPATAVVQITPIRQHGAENFCSQLGTVLWKPIDLKRIAIYSVGCEHQSPFDRLQFHLRVLDKPSLISAVPYKIAL
jgi:hypothetical protein